MRFQLPHIDVLYIPRYIQLRNRYTGRNSSYSHGTKDDGILRFSLVVDDPQQDCTWRQIHKLQLQSVIFGTKDGVAHNNHFCNKFLISIKLLLKDQFYCITAPSSRPSPHFYPCPASPTPPPHACVYDDDD